MPRLYGKLVYILVPIIFLLVYHTIFFTDYAYLDEIHTLWNNRDNSNFNMVHPQGRWLTALIFQEAYSSIDTIEQLKWLRVISLGGWIITVLVWAKIFRKWIQYMSLPEDWWWPAVLFAICSIPVAICIGWASCFEVFLGTLFALAGGHLLYASLYKQGREIKLSNLTLLGAIIAGVISLFIYQSTFGIFLLPFFLHYVFKHKNVKPDRTVIIGIVLFIVINGIYYLLFKQSLRAYNMTADSRAQLNLDILKKISFFFSSPFQQAFGINFLYSPRNITSQIIFPVIIAGWVFTSFKKNSGKPFSYSVGKIAFTILLLMLIYSATLVAKESYDSYRTLFALDIAVFFLVLDTLYYWFSRFKNQLLLIFLLSGWLLATGVYNFNNQFIYPLEKEYSAIRKYFDVKFHKDVTTIYFIRAPKNMFSSVYNVEVYRDEFGSPSTFRDWVPEPLLKQLVYEKTGNRELASKIKVVQFANNEAWLLAGHVPGRGDWLIDMNEVFKEYR